MEKRASNNRQIVPIYLNRVKDADVFEFINKLDNISDWFRKQARKEIKFEVDPKLNEYLVRLIEMRLATRGEPVLQVAPIMPNTEEEINIFDDIANFL